MLLSYQNSYFFCTLIFQFLKFYSTTPKFNLIYVLVMYFLETPSTFLNYVSIHV
jgi:hypothetical protein